jgi:hypothetical protein
MLTKGTQCTAIYLMQKMKETKYLDSEEQELIESLEGDDWKSTEDIEGWKTLLSKTPNS